jgi:hypothetical protein
VEGEMEKYKGFFVRFFVEAPHERAKCDYIQYKAYKKTHEE